jgi:signal transduction histidine kinase
MQSHALPEPAGTAAAETAPDFSPETIAALVAQGAAALRLPDALDADHAGSDSGRIADHDALALLVGVTHDMRSPLSSMLVLVERLLSGQSGPLTAAQERQLGLLYSAAFGLTTITNDALDFARGTSSLAGAAPVSFSISDLLRSVRHVVQPIAEEKGLSLRCCGPTTDRRLGQPAVLHRVLLNLMTNALKYTSTGTVTVTAKAIDATSLCFQVDDSGRGMPDDVVASLATPVWGGPFSSGAFSGSGLGLGMCRRLLGELGSDLEIEALPPTGTRVQFTLDLPSP